MEVKKAKDQAGRLDQELEEKKKAYDDFMGLWSEFNPDLISIENVELGVKKIAGVRTPILEDIQYNMKEFSIFDNPKWFLEGIESLKEFVKLAIEREVFIRKMELLDFARKKTTQKVNLYEKVQIPGYEDAIRKIKRFLEDEENLSKSAQKIVKNKQQAMEEAQ